MTFEPGNYYYVLTPGQYAELGQLLTDFGLEYDVLSNFTMGDDGNYYCAVSSGLIDSEEASFMEDYGLSNIYLYNKSSQSTSFF